MSHHAKSSYNRQTRRHDLDKLASWNKKNVFISYRRALSKHLARLVYMDLRANGWDTFLDVNSIDSGDFDRIILNQIGARAHFILLISSGSLERCANSGDWVLREIQEAVRLERNIVPVIEEGAVFDREMSYLPSDLRGSVSRKNVLPQPHFFFNAAMDMLRTRFLKPPEYIAVKETPAAVRAEVARRIAAVDAGAPAVGTPFLASMPAPDQRTAKMPSPQRLPAPFSWIDIPAGKVTPETGKTFDVPAFAIAKYPISQAQFATFIDAGGYGDRRLWTDAGWEARQKENWTEPRYSGISAYRHTPDHPVVGVSWYESVAFCRWLSDVAGGKIMLPTEQMWQRAAQGADGRYYPWGKRWYGDLCNNSVDGEGIRRTTPVRQYEGKGDSPFGVVDMAGNVWEWCLSEYQSGSTSPNGTNGRVLRGGSWFNNNSGDFRVDSRFRSNPERKYPYSGFRLARF